MPQGNPVDVASQHCSDIEYRYEIYKVRNTLYVRAYRTSIPWRDNQTLTDTLLFNCPIEKLCAKAKAFEAGENEPEQGF